MDRKRAYAVAPQAALNLRDKFVRDCLLLQDTPEGSFGTWRDPPILPAPPTVRLSSNFQRFDGRLISKIYEPFASSRSRVKDAPRSN